MTELVWRYRFTQLLVLTTLALLFVGGLVTSTDSGLAVPDWPLSYGSLFPPMVGGIRYEHTHRVVAALVGLLTLILTIWTGKQEARPWVRWLAIASLGAVVLQGILGGLTVLFLLPVPVSVAHACIGPLFFCLVVSLASLTSPENEVIPASVSEEVLSRFRFHAGLTTGFVFLQILLGALVRHTAFSAFVWTHVASAFLVFFLTGELVRRGVSFFYEEKTILRPTLALGFLVILEFFLGIGAFLFTQVEGIHSTLGPILFPTLHQTLGALLLATGLLVTLRAQRVVVKS
jgi:cytochrome c oxidase assembly protein subunit 15